MATESPMRMVENTKWPSKEASFASTSHNMAAEELGMLLRGHKGNGREGTVPNRSGSAPPSMEGSFAAIGNLINQQNPSLDASLGNLSNISGQFESEEQFRADPAYLAYYFSNVNLNPRLPPPLVSRENKRLVRHIGGYGNNRKLTSLDDSANGSLHLSGGGLSPHKEEELEDDKSPPSGDFLSPQFATSLSARHKSLVDLIQEDFPRTPSPVYNLSRSSGPVGTEESTDHDSHDPSIETKLTELNVMSGGIDVVSANSGVTGVELMPNSDTSTASISPDRGGSSHSAPKGKSSSVDITPPEEDRLIGGPIGSDVSSIESEMKGFNISNLPNAEDHKNQQRWQHTQQSSLHQRQFHSHQGGTSYQVQGMQSQIATQGLNSPYNGAEQLYHGQPKFSAVDVQPVFQPSGISPSVYATTTAYMASPNPFYPNMQPSGLFAPSFGGYALNTALFPPYLPGYPPHNAMPMAFDTTGGTGFNTRTAGGPTGGSIAPGVDLQDAYKFYGQLGLTVPPYSDPVYMHYIQHPPEDAYRRPDQYDQMATRGGLTGSHSLRGPTAAAAYTADQQNLYQRNGGLSIPDPRKSGVISPNYYGSPPSMGVLMQFPTSPLASPVMPGSPVGGMSPAGRRNDMRFSPSSSRNQGVFSGWPGQRGAERFDDPKTYSYLDELKSSKSRKFELSDIAGRIVEFSADQHGSRFIQQKLENCGAEEKASVFQEVLPHASKLMTDVFGNYVIQKFFEHGSAEQRKELANQLVGHILPLSLQMYGCRVIQKALEVIEVDQKTQLVYELDGNVLRCVRDQNGNHVIQKCIECVPTDKIGFIISAFRNQVATLSTHPYGCRVIQRVLEHCTDEQQSQIIVDEILESACALAQDQYGNYVTQHVLERGKPHERSQIISKLAGQIVTLSQHKFASNVVEKCLEHGDAAERDILIEEIVGQTEGNDNLLIMMKDQFANYVVQKVLETCTDTQREILLSRVRIHLHALKKYTYGKHIVLRFEQMFGEEVEDPET
ncbi:hypothetical protein MKX03_021057 [Papaver bracteatum]|nr:hypothetical protein MKX03_021057 [Papaver bracteatum]